MNKPNKSKNIVSLSREESKVLEISKGTHSGSEVCFLHSQLNRQVNIKTRNMEPGSVSDAIIDTIFELATLNYPSVLNILKDHGFEWERREDLS